MKKVASALVFLCIVSLIALCPEKADVQAQTMITIKTDGSIDPPTAPIQQTGDVYSLTSGTRYIRVQTSNITLDGNGFTVSGLLIDHVANATVKNFIVRDGIDVDSGPFGLFAGIYLNEASNITVTNSTITEVVNFYAVFVNYETVVGIIVKGGSSNTIYRNNLVNNFQGMEFNSTAHNVVAENNIECSVSFQEGQGFNDPAGIFFANSSNNIVYHNNFKISIGGQAGDSYGNSFNVWDDGYPSGGNYWIDYNAKEMGSSGIGSTPYEIDTNNTDRYPLMKPFNSTFFALQTTPPKITVESPVNQTYEESSVPLIFSITVFSVNKTVDWIGYSLDGKQDVTVAGNGTIPDLTNGVHRIIIYASDTLTNLGESETITFTVAVPEPISILTVATVTLIVVIAAAGLLVYFRKRGRGKTQ